MRIVPITLRTANRFVERHHRHNKPTTGHKFSIGLEKEGELIGVAIAGRPVARMLDDQKSIEVLRVCVREGCKNACSKLYARCKRIAQLMGYERVMTYTLATEARSSLKALGAKPERASRPYRWNRPSRRRKDQRIYDKEKVRWELR